MGRRPRGCPGRISGDHAAVLRTQEKHHARLLRRRARNARGAAGFAACATADYSGASIAPRPAPGPLGVLRPHMNGAAATPHRPPLASTTKPASAPAMTPRTNGGPPVDGLAAMNGAGANGAPINGGAAFDRTALTDQLISLVEERTGYPRDMLAMDQNFLLATLGIDFIKRVEIVGALLKRLPATVQPRTADLGEALNAQKTLNGILDLLWSKNRSRSGRASAPFDVTGADAPAARACARPPRFVSVARTEELPRPATPALPAGTYAITDDGAGLAPALAELIAGAGGKPKIIKADLSITPGDISGFIHLAPFGAPPIALGDAAAWRAKIEANELFPHQFVGRARSLQNRGRERPGVRPWGRLWTGRVRGCRHSRRRRRSRRAITVV